MTDPIRLKGITWNHTRGFVPKVATAQRFHELHPQVEIEWHRRSLQDFADYPIDKLAKDFDLLVIDHPSIGEAARHGIYQPLDGLISDAYLADQAANSVGASHRSYTYDGRHWALAVDAATPVASWRPDLLDKHGVRVPETWDELLDLAKRGLVAVPAIPVDSLMNLYMLWLDEGEEPFLQQDRVGDRATGAAALEALRELVLVCPSECLTRNPILTYEAMTKGDTLAYCPFAYGYTNYSRPGYARRTLTYGNLVTRKSGRLRSTLGGAGIAISASCKHPDVAAQYAAFMGEAGTQAGIFVSSGGQPGHRAAWTDDEANRITGNFFRNTLQTLDEAYLRPRHDGYIAFQDRGGTAVHAYLRGAASVTETLDELDRLHAHHHAVGMAAE